MMPCHTSGMTWSGCSATSRSAWPASDLRPPLRWPSACSVISRSHWFFMPSTRFSQAWAAASGRAARPRLSPRLRLKPLAVLSRRRRNMAKLLAGSCVVVGGTPTPQCNERLNDSPVAPATMTTCPPRAHGVWSRQTQSSEDSAMKGRNMTRWRDPAKDPRQEPKSHLITAEGAERLRGILDHLSRVKRPALSAKVGEAASLGDRSENADYTYNKKELNRVIARIRYLTKRLDELTVVDRLPADTGKVYFGAFVTLEDEDGEEMRIRIVGHDEIEPTKRWISVDSPLAKALLGKPLDEEVTVAAPGGETTYVITEIDYRDPGK